MKVLLAWWWLYGCLIATAMAVLLSHHSYGYVPRGSWDESTDLVVVTAHFSEDLDWLLGSRHPVVVCDKPGAMPMPFVADPQCTLTVNRGREVSSFLKFIVEYYDRLPRNVAFLHGHETSWHDGLPMSLLEALDRVKRGKFGYINLNNVQNSKVIDEEALRGVKRHAPHVEVGHLGHLFLQKTWSKHFEPILKIPFPEHLQFMCCAQFIVSAGTIRRHPRTTYRALYDLVMDPAHGDDWAVGAGLEFVWHILFGEPADMCEGQTAEECSPAGYLATRYD